MSTTTSSAQSDHHNAYFAKRLEEAKPSKTDTNRVIMDYLVSEGYPSAASWFAREASISLTTDASSIEARVAIRTAIHCGDIKLAIEKINDLNTEILDCEPALHFSLLRLQLIEMIRKSAASQDTNDIVAVFDFASTQLAPRAPKNPEFKDDLEKAMALLIYPQDTLSPPLSALLDPQLRKDVAARVNQATLESQGLKREARIKGLIKMRAWSEQKCRENKKMNLPPSVMQLNIDRDERQEDSMMEDGESSLNGNGAVGGGDAMVT